MHARGRRLLVGLLALAAACSDASGEPPPQDVAASETGGGGGTGVVGLLPTGAVDAGLDATVATATQDAEPTLPPPTRPPVDERTTAHVLLERDGALWVARVVPGGGYVGPVGDALPVLPEDLDEGVEPVLWARDEGPRVVVDFGGAGVYAGQGAAWTKLGDAPEGDVTATSLVVRPDVDRVLLGYTTRDPITSQMFRSGALWSIDGAALHTVEPYMDWQSGAYGVFAKDWARAAVRSAAGTEVIDADSGGVLETVPTVNQDVQAIFDTSLIAGSPPWLNWFSYDLMLVTPMELTELGQWSITQVDRAPHVVIDGTLHVLEDRAVVPVWPLVEGMTGSSVFGYVQDRHLFGLSFSSADDAGFRQRDYVLLGPDGVPTDTFVPEPSVVEEEGGLTGVDWERRPTAVAWHLDADRAAVVMEVRHTYFRGAYGVSAALTEELWLVDGVGTRVHRLGQHPPDDDGGALPRFDRQWAFTPDGAHLVWTDAGDVEALDLETLEPAPLREAF